MNKEDFVWILQSALLNFDGITQEEMIELGARPELVRAGIKLCSYLKSLKIGANEMQQY